MRGQSKKATMRAKRQRSNARLDGIPVNGGWREGRIKAVYQGGRVSPR